MYYDWELPENSDLDEDARPLEEHIARLMEEQGAEEHEHIEPKMQCSFKADTGWRESEPKFDDYQCGKEMGHDGPHKRRVDLRPIVDKVVWHEYQHWYDSGAMLFDEPLDPDVSLVYHESWSQFGIEYRPGGYE